MDAKELLERYAAGERDFSGVFLARLNLRNVNLRGVNLRGANLSNAVLEGADLSQADLSNANLDNVDLIGSKLNNAILTDASLAGEINLTGAELREADMRRANLQYVHISWANLINVNLSGANLKYGRITETCLTGVNLQGADLSQAELSYNNLINANLNHANLIGAILNGNDLMGVDLSNVQLTGVKRKRGANLILTTGLKNPADLELIKRLKQAGGLGIPSDGDYLTTFFLWEVPGKNEITIKDIVHWGSYAENTAFEVRDFLSGFNYADEKIFANYLSNIKIYYLAEGERKVFGTVDVYVIGKTPSGNFAGCTAQVSWT